MFSLVYYIFLLSFLEMQSCKTLIEKRMYQSQSSSSMGRTISPPRIKLENAPPGSFLCERDLIVPKKSVNEIVQTACERAHKKWGGNADSPGRLRAPEDHHPETIETLNGYKVLNTEVFYTNHLPSHGLDNLYFQITFYYDLQKKSRCFPKSGYIESRTNKIECTYKDLRNRIKPIESIPPDATFTCDRTKFSAAQINAAIGKAIEMRNLRKNNFSRSNIIYPASFRDQLYVNEDDLWMYPVLFTGETYNQGLDEGRFRVVFQGNGKPVGVVAETTRLGKQAWERLDWSLDFEPCQMTTGSNFNA